MYAARSFGARDIDIESSEEEEAKWRSYSNTVSHVLDSRELEEAGKDEGTGLRKHKRKMERKMLWLLKPAAGRRVNEANGWMRNKLKSS